MFTEFTKYVLLGQNEYITEVTVHVDPETKKQTITTEGDTHHPDVITIPNSTILYDNIKQAMEAREEHIQSVMPETYAELLAYPLIHQIAPYSIEADIYIHAVEAFTNHELHQVRACGLDLTWEAELISGEKQMSDVEFLITHRNGE